MSSLCLFPKNLTETKLKSFRIILLSEAILRQLNIDFLCYYDYSNAEQKEILKNVQFDEEKGNLVL